MPLIMPPLGPDRGKRSSDYQLLWPVQPTNHLPKSPRKRSHRRRPSRKAPAPKRSPKSAAKKAVSDRPEKSVNAAVKNSRSSPSLAPLSWPTGRNKLLRAKTNQRSSRSTTITQGERAPAGSLYARTKGKALATPRRDGRLDGRRRTGHLACPRRRQRSFRFRNAPGRCRGATLTIAILRAQPFVPGTGRRFTRSMRRLKADRSRHLRAICEMSGKPILRARLEAIPFARFHGECQSQLEKQSKASRGASVGHLALWPDG
jgi:hypothetical protein